MPRSIGAGSSTSTVGCPPEAVTVIVVGSAPEKMGVVIAVGSKIPISTVGFAKSKVVVYKYAMLMIIVVMAA